MTDFRESTIGAYEAKTHFSELLERVASGEEVTITRHGSPVARIVPIQQGHSRDDRREAIERIKKLAHGNSLRGLKIKDLISKGRR
jgi:prevent-host-death family protein